MPDGRTPPNAVVFGCKGTTLEEEEKRFFAQADPLGFILFARNIDNPGQVLALSQSLRDCVGRDAPIFVDQEGGRVQRLRPPLWPSRPPMAVFGRLARKNIPLAVRSARLNARLIAADLLDAGIDVDCAPLVDLPVDGAHDVIGDRAFGSGPEMTALLGRAVLDGLLDGGVMGVVKHIPGHGRATADSHHELPIVEETRAVLAQTDFAPFAALADAPFAMTAHVVYQAIDPAFPATLSRIVIESVIRGEIGCRSFLLSDDLSMKALSGSFAERTSLSLAAGCDAALHCNGDMAEMEQVLRGASPLTDAALSRLEQAASQKRRTPLPEDAEDGLDRWLSEA